MVVPRVTCQSVTGSPTAANSSIAEENTPGFASALRACDAWSSRPAMGLVRLAADDTLHCPRHPPSTPPASLTIDSSVNLAVFGRHRDHRTRSSRDQWLVPLGREAVVRSFDQKHESKPGVSSRLVPSNVSSRITNVDSCRSRYSDTFRNPSGALPNPRELAMSALETRNDLFSFFHERVTDSNEPFPAIEDLSWDNSNDSLGR